MVDGSTLARRDACLVVAEARDLTLRKREWCAPVVRGCVSGRVRCVDPLHRSTYCYCGQVATEMYWTRSKSEWQTVVAKGKRIMPDADPSLVAPPLPAERMGLCASALRDAVCKLLERRAKCKKLQKWWRSVVSQAELHEILRSSCTIPFDTTR